MKSDFHQKREWMPFNGTELNLSDQTSIFKVDVHRYYQTIDTQYDELLPAFEIEESMRFRQETDRMRFIACRHSLRRILSFHSSLPAKDIEIKKSIRKKPFTHGIEFNISHSGNMILIAIASTTVGIDIEIINPKIDYTDLKSQCFALDEQLQIKSATDFFGLWTRKEALLKASGEGLINEMANINCLEQQVTRHQVSYQIDTFSIQGGYVFSLATVAGSKPIKYISFI